MNNEVLSPNFKDVFPLCAEILLDNLVLSDVLNLRFVDKSVNAECCEYLNKKKKFKINYKIKMDFNNKNIFFKKRIKKDKKSILKPSILFVSDQYAVAFRSPLPYLPFDLSNITKFFFKLNVPSFFETFDAFFSRMPNLKHFGFDCTKQYSRFYNEHKFISYNLWNTKIYPNIEELELLCDNDMCYNLWYYCNDTVSFISKQFNIKTLRISWTILNKNKKEFLEKNIRIENLYIHWNGFWSAFNTEVHTQRVFTELFEKNVYKNLYFQIDRAIPYPNVEFSFPGLQEVNLTQHIPHYEERKSEWFSF